MGSEIWIIIGVAVVIAIAIIIFKTKKEIDTPWSWEQCEQFVDDLVRDGDIKECLREVELMKFKKEAGCEDAMTDDDMEQYLYNLMENGELSQEEVDDEIEIYRDVVFGSNPKGYTF